MNSRPVRSLVHSSSPSGGSVALVVNLHADRGARLYSAAIAALRRRGIGLDAAYGVRGSDRVQPIVEQLIAQGYRRIVVGGGDGTISGVVGCFVGQDAVLGILPLGTGNSFAHSLGLPLDLEGAVEVCLAGRVAEVDLGRVGDRYFAEAASIGFTSVPSFAAPEWLKRRLGVLAYVVSGVRRFVASRPFRYRICLPEGRFELRTYLVIVSNGGYFGTRRIEEGATADDGRFVVAAVDTLEWWKLLRLTWDYLVGRPPPLPGLRCWNASEVTIDADPAQRLNVDGQIQDRTPARFTIAPRALRVMLPRH